MICIRANKPGSVCATQANPFSGLARAAGVHPLLAHYRACWFSMRGLSAQGVPKMVRTEMQSNLHRLANYLEGQLSDVLRELLASSMIEECQDITYHGCTFIQSLRDLSDKSEGEGGAK